MIQHIHANRQKIGIYMKPGVGASVVAANPPILGSPYHIQDIIVNPPTIGNGFGNADKIDFTKPGAQEYTNSIIDLYASWGIDFIKLNAVTPGSYNDNLNINNIPDVQAMSKPLRRAPRLFTNPIRGEETSSSCRRFHFFPAELHRQLGGAFGDSLDRMRGIAQAP